MNYRFLAILPLIIVSLSLQSQTPASDFDKVYHAFKTANPNHPVYYQLTETLLEAAYDKACAINTTKAYKEFLDRYEKAQPNHPKVLKVQHLMLDSYENDMTRDYERAEALNTAEAYNNFYEKYKTTFSDHPLVIKSLRMKKNCEIANSPILIKKIYGSGESTKEAFTNAEQKLNEFVQQSENRHIQIFDIIYDTIVETDVLETNVSIIVLYKKAN